MQDNSKIARKLAELNQGLDEPEWEQAQGFHALTGFEFGSKEKRPVFKPDFGIPIKAFVNKRTGEFKIFPALNFVKDE